MNMLRKIIPMRIFCTRLMETNVPIGKRLVIEPLSERELVRVRGDDVEPFLQGLITNDINHLQADKQSKCASIYSLFLNKGGRVMYDSIIYRTTEPNSFLIECDKQVTSDLRRHLRLYRVRRKIDIETIEKELKPWIVFNPDQSSAIDTSRLANNIISTADPRFQDLGLRVLMNPKKLWMDLAKYFATPNEVNVLMPTSECNYRLHRYRNGIAEGSKDLLVGKSLPLEMNCDILNGVSFQKGCYIGQELTARVYHTGVIRKRLMPLRLTGNVSPTATNVQNMGGTNIGTLRGVCYNRALALMRVEQTLNTDELMIDGEVCYSEKPVWWPKELTGQASVRKGQ